MCELYNIWGPETNLQATASQKNVENESAELRWKSEVKICFKKGKSNNQKTVSL